MTTEIITLAAPAGRLQALSDGARKWLRVGQICPTLGVHERTFERILQRDPDLVPEGHTMMIAWPTEGGEQMLRVYSLDVVLNVAMEINNKQARRFRRWVVAQLTGTAPVSRAPANALERLADARTLLAHSRTRTALQRLEALDAADREHQRRQARVRSEVQRLARGIGMELRDLRDLAELERILGRIPSLGAQPALPLDA